MFWINPKAWGLGALIVWSKADRLGRWPASLECELWLGPLSLTWSWRRKTDAKIEVRR
jgi:hypothetical protein